MLQRILALIVKELISLWKDPKTRYVLIIPPLIQVLLFANAANYDVSNARLAIWNDDQGRHSTELIRRFADSKAFRPVAIVASPDAAQRAIDTKDAAAVLRFGQTFSADVEAGRPAAVQLLLDTRRSNTALMIDGYASDIVATYAAALQPGGAVPLVVETRNWFNPTLDSRWFVLPGLVAVLPFLMAMLVSALSLSREREFGTFEQMLVTPLGPLEIMIGKAVPAILVGWIEANMVLAAAVLWFGVPFVGSLALLEGALLVYMLAGVSIGLAISAFARTQQQGILGVFVYAAPATVLSGFASPIENMPPAFEWLSRLDPIRYMIVLSRGVFLQDMRFEIALLQIWPMALIGFVLLTLATVAVRRALVQ